MRDKTIAELGSEVEDLRRQLEDARKVARLFYVLSDITGNEYRWAVDTMRGWK